MDELLSLRSVRSGDWKLIKYDAMDGEVRETQLFNLKDNPHEFLTQHQADAISKLTGSKPSENQRDLAEDPKYADIRKKMEGYLLKKMKRHGDPYTLWDQPTEP